MALWIPILVSMPDKSVFELDATDPEKATLKYAETFTGGLQPEAAERTRHMLLSMMAVVKKQKSDFDFDVRQEGDSLVVTATGPRGALASGVLGEFLFQSFSKNPEKQFWRWVDEMQNFMSTSTLPIRKMYLEITGGSLDEPAIEITGEAIRLPIPKMVKARCSECGLKLEIPEDFVGKGGSMRCANAECKHDGKPDWTDSTLSEAVF